MTLAPVRCLYEACDGTLEHVPDELLPFYMERYECRECGEWYEFDRDDGTFTVDA